MYRRLTGWPTKLGIVGTSTSYVS